MAKVLCWKSLDCIFYPSTSIIFVTTNFLKFTTYLYILCLECDLYFKVRKEVCEISLNTLFRILLRLLCQISNDNSVGSKEIFIVSFRVEKYFYCFLLKIQTKAIQKKQNKGSVIQNQIRRYIPDQSLLNDLANNLNFALRIQDFIFISLFKNIHIYFNDKKNCKFS